MTGSDQAQPPTDSGDNGEAVLASEGTEPAEQARRQADQIAGHRRPSGTGNPPTGDEPQRQSEPG